MNLTSWWCRDCVCCIGLAVLSLVSFSHWKWACKTRHWGPRPRPSVLGSRRDRDLTDFLETETFQKRLPIKTSRPRLHACCMVCL